MAMLYWEIMTQLKPSIQSNERKQKHLRLLGGSLFKLENPFNKYLYRVHAKTFTIINCVVVLVRVQYAFCTSDEC